MNKNRNSLYLPQQCYGEKLMVRNKATAAPYGILISGDGQTVEQCLDCPGKTMNQATSDFSDGPVMGGM